jgi:hypothetical protein
LGILVAITLVPLPNAFASLLLSHLDFVLRMRLLENFSICINSKKQLHRKKQIYTFARFTRLRFDGGWNTGPVRRLALLALNIG